MGFFVVLYIGDILCVCVSSSAIRSEVLEYRGCIAFVCEVDLCWSEYLNFSNKVYYINICGAIRDREADGISGKWHDSLCIIT